MFKPPTEL
jgi:hypothetical protein